jgi:hypothetical protein
MNKEQLTNKTMGMILYIIAIILIISWLIGFIGFGFGGIIHSLLVLAVVAIILNVIAHKV